MNSVYHFESYEVIIMHHAFISNQNVDFNDRLTPPSNATEYPDNSTQKVEDDIILTLLNLRHRLKFSNDIVITKDSIVVGVM